MHLRLEPHADHVERILDTTLLVDDVLLGNDVDDLTVHGDDHGLRRVYDPVHVRAGDLPPATGDSHHAAGVQPLDVAAGDAGHDVLHLTPGHLLGGLHGGVHRLEGGLDVDHHAAAEAGRGRGAHTDDLELVVLIVLADDGRHLGGADVEADENVTGLHAHPSFVRYTICPVRKSSSSISARRPSRSSASRTIIIYLKRDPSTSLPIRTGVP